MRAHPYNTYIALHCIYIQSFANLLITTVYNMHTVICQAITISHIWIQFISIKETKNTYYRYYTFLYSQIGRQIANVNGSSFSEQIINNYEVDVDPDANMFHIHRDAYTIENLLSTINHSMSHYAFVIDTEAGESNLFRATVQLIKKDHSGPSLRYLKISATREMLFQLGK